MMALLSIHPETRRTLSENDRQWPFKLAMRAVATLFAFIAMVLFAASTDMTKKNYGGNDWVDGMPLTPVSEIKSRSSVFFRPWNEQKGKGVDTQTAFKSYLSFTSSTTLIISLLGSSRPLLQPHRPGLQLSLPQSAPDPSRLACGCRSPHLGSRNPIDRSVRW